MRWAPLQVSGAPEAQERHGGRKPLATPPEQPE